MLLKQFICVIVCVCIVKTAHLFDSVRYCCECRFVGHEMGWIFTIPLNCDLTVVLRPGNLVHMLSKWRYFGNLTLKNYNDYFR